MNDWIAGFGAGFSLGAVVALLIYLWTSIFGKKEE